MANTKISALPAAATVGNTDLVPLVQGGATKAATVVQLLASVLGANPPAALDTLKELADAIGDDPNYAANLVTALNGKTPAMTATAVKTAAYTAGLNEIVPVDATSAAVTVTLPTVPADKTRVTVKKIDASTNKVTVTAGGTDMFNKTGGSTTATLTILNQSTTVQYAAGTGIWYVVAADAPLSQLDTRYAAAGRAALGLYDDFAVRPDGPLAGIVPQVGPVWGTTGAALPVILNGRAQSSSAGYLYTTLTAKPSTLACDVTWSGSGTGGAMTMAWCKNGPGAAMLNDFVHFNFGPIGFTLTVRADGGTFDQLLAGSWRRACTIDGTTITRVAASLRDQTLTIYGPNGEVFAVTDPRIASQSGTTVFWEPNLVSTLQAQLVRPSAVLLAPTGQVNGYPVLGEQSGSGFLTDDQGRAVGSRNSWYEVAVGRDSGTNMPAVAYGPKTILTVLNSDAATGATSIVTVQPIPNGSTVQLESGNNSETVTTTGNPTGTGPYTSTVAALTKTHLAGSAITATTTKQVVAYYNIQSGIFYLPNPSNGVVVQGNLLFGTGLDASLARTAAGVVSTGSAGALRTGRNATASRPAASTMGQAAQFYDTTLNKPIWSDGTQWRDATGTVV